MQQGRRNGGAAPAAKTTFSVSLPGALETYGVEDPQAAGQIAPYYENVVVYLVDAGNNAMGYSWMSAEISAKQKRFEQVVEPAKVIVVANTGSTSLLTGPTSLASIENGLKTWPLPIRTGQSRPSVPLTSKATLPATIFRYSR